MPEDVEVEREPTALLAVDRPEEVEVERDVTLLLVDDRPVESDPTPL